MKIFYILSIILFTTVHAKSQDRNIVSINQEDVSRIIRFYPNPATSLINFDFQKNYDKTYNLQIFNFLGKKVHEVSNVTPKTIVNLSDFKSGVFLYHLSRNGKVVEIGKFQVAK